MLWTYIIRCKDCHRELNRAEHVPDERKTQVAISAVFAGRCEIDAHNTASDYNLHHYGEWVLEGDAPSRASDKPSIALNSNSE